MELLRIENVHAGYGKKEVLRGLSLTVQQGKIVALLGGNGAGKSTALKAVAGELRPWSGRIALNGVVISRNLPHETRRAGLSYLPQGGRVFKELTVDENLSVCRGAAGGSCRELLFPELYELGPRRAGLLSGGERQMLAIEMALRDAPAIVLLDEPTAALAQGLATRILDQVAALVRANGTGVLLVEQNVHEATRVADLVYRLARGRTAECWGMESANRD